MKVPPASFQPCTVTPAQPVDFERISQRPEQAVITEQGGVLRARLRLPTFPGGLR